MKTYILPSTCYLFGWRLNLTTRLTRQRNGSNFFIVFSSAHLIVSLFNHTMTHFLCQRLTFLLLQQKIQPLSLIFLYGYTFGLWLVKICVSRNFSDSREIAKTIISGWISLCNECRVGRRPCQNICTKYGVRSTASITYPSTFPNFSPAAGFFLHPAELRQREITRMNAI